MLYIANSFSLSMIPTWLVVYGCRIAVESIPADLIRETIIGASMRHGDPVSAVGHADTAALFSAILERTIAPNRITVALTVDDELIVGQYSGPRLPEGTTRLPEGASITWIMVSITIG